MGLESVRTNDKYETLNGCVRDPFVTQLQLNRRRKINGYNSHQHYCGSQIASNVSTNNDQCSNSTNYNYLWRVCRERGVLFEGINNRKLCRF